MSFFFETKPIKNVSYKLLGRSNTLIDSLQIDKPTTNVTTSVVTYNSLFVPPTKYEKIVALIFKVKRTFLSTNLNGSITVEASIVLPIFLFAMISVIYLFNIMYIQSVLQIQLENTAAIVNASTCVTSEADISLTDNESSFLEKVIVDTAGAFLFETMFMDEELKDFLDNTLIVDGSNGLTFIGSKITNLDEPHDVVLRYSVALPFISPDVLTINMEQHCYFKPFNGKELRQNIYLFDRSVYIAHNGTVFHSNASCSYLERLTFCVSLAIAKDKNPSITPCTRCYINTDILLAPIPDQRNYIYVTEEYDVYHKLQYCSHVERNVQVISYTEAMEKYTPCSRCVVYENSE